MPTIRPTRDEISDRFPILGFNIQTGGSPYFEVMLTTRPGEPPEKRTPATFYSTRALGPLPAHRKETIWLAPPELLRRFAGASKLYFGLATFPDASRASAEVVRDPTSSSPYVNLRSYTGRAPRRLQITPIARRGGPDPGYTPTAGEELTWAGDQARPGTETVGTPPSPGQSGLTTRGNGNGNGNGQGQGNGSGTDPRSRQQPAPSAPVGSPAPATGQAVAMSAYDDGFGDLPAPAVLESEPGIEGPIPDAPAAAASLRHSRAQNQTAEYPQASRFVAAHPGNYQTSASPRSISRIVIHITDGGPSINGPISWFQNPQARVSAHYIVGQDGEVVQMVRHNDVAWHASRANGDSLGIEHVANTRGLNPTETQYCAAAALVSWLCDQFHLPKDRQHILGHAEADPRTKHTACPNAVWDWDYFMGLVTSNSCYPRAGSAAQSLGRGLRGRALDTERIFYDVHLHAQPNKLSCWAAAMAMLVSFRQSRSLNPETLAQEVGRSLRTSYGWDMLEAVKDHYGFHAIPLPSEPKLYFSPQQWFAWLRDHGPLWVTTVGNPSHAIIVHGISGDLTPGGTTVNILNPWNDQVAFDDDEIDFHPANYGRAYSQSFDAFANDFGHLGLADYGSWRVLYLPGAAAQAQGFRSRPGVAAAASTEDSHVEVRELLRGEGLSEDQANQLLAQLQQGGQMAPVAAAAGAFRARTLNREIRVMIPHVRTLTGWEARGILLLLSAAAGGAAAAATVLFPGLAPAAAMAAAGVVNSLPGLADRYGLAIGIGPNVGGFAVAGGSIGAGVVFGPGGVIGVYGSTEVGAGIIASISAVVQVTVVSGGMSSFAGDSVAIVISGGEGVVGGIAVLQSAPMQFQGVSFQAGLGVGLNPVDIYMSAQHTWTSTQGLAMPPTNRGRPAVLPPTALSAPATPLRRAPAVRPLTGDDALPDPAEEEGYEEESAVISQPQTASGCSDGFCEVNPAATAGTAHFSLAEFQCRDGTPVPEPFRGNTQQLMENLEVFRGASGDKLITIVSGYRTCTYNSTLEGAASRSRHLCGQAADLRVADMTPQQVRDAIERLISEGRMRQGGLGLYDTFVHYDIRGTRARWDKRRRAAAAALTDPGEVAPDYSQAHSTTDAIRMFVDWLRRQLSFRIGISDTSFFPHSAIAKLRLLDGQGGLVGEGSGFYVGRNKVVTAGHCLVNDDGSRVQGVEVVPGLHGRQEPFGGGSVGLSGLRPHPSYNPLAYDAAFDIGVIVGAPNAPHGDFFEMEEMRMSPQTGVITCGYAAVGVDPTVQHMDVDTIRELHNGTFTYAAQVREGSSGGPVFYALDAHTIRAVGLNVTAFDDHRNQGLRLTDAMIRWINSL